MKHFSKTENRKTSGLLSIHEPSFIYGQIFLENNLQGENNGAGWNNLSL